jgi:hypothetical protein
MLLCEPPPQVYYIESNYNYQFSGILLSIFRSGFGARLSPHPYEAHSNGGGKENLRIDGDAGIPML